MEPGYSAKFPGLADQVVAEAVMPLALGGLPWWVGRAQIGAGTSGAESSMSIYHVVQWTVRPSDVPACEAQLAVICAHIKAKHPGIKSIRTYRQAWGPLPRRAYIRYEQYDGLTAMDEESKNETPECAEVWEPIERMAQEGTYIAGIWSDPNRALWFEREK